MTLATSGEQALVRALGARDLDGVLALNAELRPSDPVVPRATLESTFARMLATPSLLQRGVFVDGRLVSTAQMVLVDNLTRGARPYAIIENAGTLHLHKRRGYGALCLRALIERVWQAGCYKVSLTSGVSRAEEAHRFYDALGFDRDAKRAFVLLRPA